MKNRSLVAKGHTDLLMPTLSAVLIDTKDPVYLCDCSDQLHSHVSEMKLERNKLKKLLFYSERKEQNR